MKFRPKNGGAPAQRDTLHRYLTYLGIIHSPLNHTTPDIIIVNFI